MYITRTDRPGKLATDVERDYLKKLSSTRLLLRSALLRGYLRMERERLRQNAAKLEVIGRRDRLLEANSCH